MPTSRGDGPSDGFPADPLAGVGRFVTDERVAELARQAERAFNENVDRLRTQSREAAQAANEQIEQARTYVVERVQERPIAVTLAVLGAGFVIGLLFAGRRR
jgi:ElaB/YqjD/DUF883 family membrane-anchored ribosome-binding protein